MQLQKIDSVKSKKNWQTKEEKERQDARHRDYQAWLELQKKGQEPPKEDENAKREWARKVKDATAYYKKLREQREEDLADDEEKIELRKKQRLEELKEKERYFRDYQDYINATALIEQEAEEERQKLSAQKTAEFWAEMAGLQVSFFESSGDESVDAIGKMANQITAGILTILYQIHTLQRKKN